jgi:hypothetical protein
MKFEDFKGKFPLFNMTKTPNLSCFLFEKGSDLFELMFGLKYIYNNGEKSLFKNIYINFSYLWNFVRLYVSD